MSFCSACVLALCTAALALLLQGCGPSGGDQDGSKIITTSGPTQTGSTTQGPTPTNELVAETIVSRGPDLVNPAHTAPLSVQQAVTYLNGLYKGFDENDDSSPLGVTISMAAQHDSFYGNIFCSIHDNPKGKTSCHQGGADCKLSASLYNHKMIIDSKTNKSLLGLGRHTGFVVNQTRVEGDLSKCSYIWDGATHNRYNGGCGQGAPGNDCNDKRTAFHNVCPSTKKTCTADADEVIHGLCKEYGGLHHIPPAHAGHPQCAFPGPALDHHGQPDFKPGTSTLRNMAKARVKYNNGSDAEGPNSEKWNEIVIDEALLLPEINKEPALIIPAFIYTKSGLPISKQNAIRMRDEYCSHHKISAIPLVEVDDTQYQPDGPFKVPAESGAKANAPAKAEPQEQQASANEETVQQWAPGTDVPPRSDPMSTDAAVKYLNDLYTGWDETKDGSPLGVTISMAANPHSFYSNIYCSTHHNPNGNTQCWNGHADCRLSASLYNSKMIVDSKTKKSLLGLGRMTGFVVNQSMVETEFGKCAFIFDGATNNRYNRGCGGGAPGHNCKDKATAFHNICPSTNKICTVDAEEVKHALCQPYGGHHPIPPTHGGHYQCAFPGPALDYHGQADFKTGKSALRDMVKARLRHNGGSDAQGANSEKWNEVVIDETLLLPEIWNDPALVIPAFIYTKSGMPISRKNAEAMRDEFCKVNHVPHIPLVEVDDTQYRPEGPFIAPEGGALLEIQNSQFHAAGNSHFGIQPFSSPIPTHVLRQLEGSTHREMETESAKKSWNLTLWRTGRRKGSFSMIAHE